MTASRLVTEIHQERGTASVRRSRDNVWLAVTLRRRRFNPRAGPSINVLPVEYLSMVHVTSYYTAGVLAIIVQRAISMGKG